MKTLQVPARCHNGHHLEPRTVYVRHTGATASRSGLTPTGWECVVCVRVACWTAQFPDRPAPDELLEAENYKRQLEGVFRARMPRFTAAVYFRSGWQFANSDSTPDMRAERIRAAAEAERRELARQEREQQDIEDRRVRQIRREHAERVPTDHSRSHDRFSGVIEARWRLRVPAMLSAADCGCGQVGSSVVQSAASPQKRKQSGEGLR